MTSEAVVPGPGDFGASALATVRAGRAEVCFTVTNPVLSSLIQSIAVYEAPRGQAGPMVARLSPSSIGLNQLHGCVPVDAAVARGIGRSPENYYIEIRTFAHPGGAVRSQLR